MKEFGCTVTNFQNLTKRSMTPRWPLTPLLLRSYVWLYQRIIFIQSHENNVKVHVCGWIQWPFFPSKTWTKGHWHLNDLWPKSVEVTSVTLPKDHSGFEIRNKSKGSPGSLPLKLWGSSLILKGPKTTRHFFTVFIHKIYCLELVTKCKHVDNYITTRLN